jgi:DNA repair exonuclease SbcCD nuclease subunit
MTEFLLVGDTHIGRLANIFPDKDWQDWTLAPLRQVEAYAKNHGIKTILQTGDVFDVANPEQKLLRLLTKFLLNSELHWLFGMGNHDVSHRGQHSLIMMNYLAKQKKLRNCHFFPTEAKIKLNNIPVVFLPWPKTTSRLLTEPSLVIAHVERAGAIYDDGRVVRGHAFKLGKHFWGIGHLHRYQLLENGIFPGAINQLRYGDIEQQYFIHLKIRKTAGRLRVKFKRIKFVPQFILRDLIIKKLADLQQLQHVPDNHFIRLIIHQDVAVPVEYLQHAQVLKYRFFGDKRDLQAIKTDSFNLQITQASMQSRKRALKYWLRQKTQLSKLRVKYAVRYATQLEAKVIK